MVTIRRFGIGFSALILGAFLVACAGQQVRTAYLGQGPTDPALVHGALPNGFQYLILRNTTPKDRVSLHLKVFTGSVQETEAEQGLAHYLEHMLFNGSEHFKPGELVTYFQSIGMDFGADANARTSFFSTVYDLNLPKGDAAHLKDAFLVIRDYAGGALLLESEVNRERGVVLAEKRERDSVSFRRFEKELAFEFPGSLLARRLPIGKAEVLNTAGRDLLKGFYDRWYRPDNMALVVVGDVDPDQVRDLVEKSFSSLKARSGDRDGKIPDIAWQPHTGVNTFYLHEPEDGKTRLTIERVAFTQAQPETPALIKQKVVRFLGDLMLENRLSRMVREQAADFTAADVYSGTYLNNVFTAAIQAECEPGRWSQSLTQLENVLRQALVYGFQTEEFDRVRADYLASLDSTLAGAETRKSSQLASSLLGALDRNGLFLSPAQEAELLKPFVQNLALSEVVREFRESWAEDHRLVLVAGNVKIPDAPEATIQSVYKEAANRPISPYVMAEIRSFPYLTLPRDRAGIVGQEEDVKGLGISRFSFGNQVRLNLKPTEFKKGAFWFKAVFGNGRAGMPPELNGFASLAEALVRESGVGGMDLDQLEAALAGQEVSIGFKIGDTYFSLEGSGDKDKAELVFQLLYTYLTDPGFKAKGLELAKTRFRQAYEAMERTPDGMMQIRGEKFLAGGRPEFGPGTPAAADAVSMAQIEQWLRPEFSHAPLEISLAGDMDVPAVLAAARTYLGALGERRNPDIVDAKKAEIRFPAGQELVLDLDTRIDKGVVRAAFRTDDYWDITKTRRLSVLSRVFSERLRKQIREALGASYSPYVFNEPSLVYDGYGVMQAVVNTATDTFELVIGQVDAIALDLAKNGVTAEELNLVKAPILTHLEVLRQDNSYWLNSVMADSFRHPEKLDWAGHLVRGYQDITPEELSDLARQYLKDRALILIRPR